MSAVARVAAVVILLAAALVVTVTQPIGPPAPAPVLPVLPVLPAVVPAPPHSHSLLTRPSASTPARPSTSPCAPSGLRIPSLGVDAAVVRIGLEPGGTLGTPAEVDKGKAGWYPSVLAGSPRGTMIMDGHTYHDNSAVFKTSFHQSVHLGMLIELACADHRTFAYRVSDLQLDLTPETYPGFVDSRHLYAASGPPRLITVTCTDWDALHRVWRHRAVLTSEPVG